MHELTEIVRAVQSSDEEFVLATIVDVVGSSYRRPAARMLILPDGEHIGAISGGCLERDLCRAALDLTKNGPRLVSFDTRQESTDFNPRYNLGCNGIIYVLLQRVTRDEACPTYYLSRILDAPSGPERSGNTIAGVDDRKSKVVATVYQVDPQGGSLELGSQFTDPSELEGSSEFGYSIDQLRLLWSEVNSAGRPVCCEIAASNGSVRVLVEKISPPRPFWIFGAGNDAIPLAMMARQLGWDVTIADHRASELTSTRFPDCRLVCKAWNQLEDVLQACPETVTVLLTHSFTADQTLLPWLLNSSARYVGVLGPKSRTGKVIRALHESGQLPDEHAFHRLHTPVGLDIGATTPAEIAVSVVAEIIAVDQARAGGMLQQRESAIHEPVRHVLIENLPSYSLSSKQDVRTT